MSNWSIPRISLLERNRSIGVMDDYLMVAFLGEPSKEQEGKSPVCWDLIISIINHDITTFCSILVPRE